MNKQKPLTKPELVAPAGSLHKLKYAVLYGADAVYIGGKNFSLRAGAHNFSVDEIEQGVEFAHLHNAKVYLALNSVLFNDDLHEFAEYVSQISHISIDGVIISDPGALSILKQHAPHFTIHLSTQTSTTNVNAIRFWAAQGIKRIVMAREVSFDDLTEIKSTTDCEIEVFVHGAMCMAYSGRCMLSSYLAHRDANRGDCAHPCRWSYKVTELTRPDESFPIIEDEKGASIFSSKDLCLFDFLARLTECGVDAFKIEGRMKSEYYIATVVRAYRHGIDTLFSSGGEDISFWRNELDKVSHREYTTGFTVPSNKSLQTYSDQGYIRECDYLGEVTGSEGGRSLVNVKNKLLHGEVIECIDVESTFETTIEDIFTLGNEPLKEVHPGQQAYIYFSDVLKPFTLLRSCQKKRM